MYMVQLLETQDRLQSCHGSPTPWSATLLSYARTSTTIDLVQKLTSFCKHSSRPLLVIPENTGLNVTTCVLFTVYGFSTCKLSILSMLTNLRAWTAVSQISVYAKSLHIYICVCISSPPAPRKIPIPVHSACSCTGKFSMPTLGKCGLSSQLSREPSLN